MKNLAKKAIAGAAAAAAAGATGLALAPAASASTVGDAPVAGGYVNVTDSVTPFDAPGAFNPGPGAVIVSPAYGTATPIACHVDNANIWRDCYQEGWNHEAHQVHYLLNINGHPTYATVDLPQGFALPQIPTVSLPAGSVVQSLQSTSNSVGSALPGFGAQGNIGANVGSLGLNVGGQTGSL